MKKLDLAGAWLLRETGNDELMGGVLPGCNYLDLMANGKIPDPFWGMNEEEAKEVAEKDFEYSKKFFVPPDLLQEDRAELVVSGLDTLAEIWLNENKIAGTDNAHRIYRFSVKEYLKEEDNLIRIYFKATMPYLREMQEQNPLPSIMLNVKGVSHIRKPQCHFGWDWGPILPPAGISGYIGLESVSIARFKEVKVNQKHSPQKAELNIHIDLEDISMQENEKLSILYRLTKPDGTVWESCLPAEGLFSDFTIPVIEPRLWWSNGLGGQPLYHLAIFLYQGEDVLDQWEKNIGLRTLKLDTSPDEWGSNFRFLVNDVPIFAKGADWIPTDSFVTRTSAEDLEFYINSACEANMNMLRVWGGGYYESDIFYDLCDKYGILVWQDFGFACMPYPFYDEEFLNNIRQEVTDNVRRLRHHPSLALWSGNNEIELISGLWKKKKELYRSGQDFFYKILPEWVAKEDEVTPYWPGSPSSGSLSCKPNDLNRGDTHLWQVWHGMMPIEAFRKYPTRFCSEFGMESLPSLRTVGSFTDDSDIGIFSPVMLAHQKSGGGNQKMLFYILAKYRNPATFKDFIYLSQLIQAETVRYATEQWRRNMGRCNGALYWQYNDCWPVASWAGIDYGKQYKAVQYRAKHFNRMCCVSADVYSRRADIYVINEYPYEFKGSLKWELTDFYGNVVSSGEEAAAAGAGEARKIISLRYKTILDRHKKKNVVLVLYLEDDREVLSKQTCLLVSDKKAALIKPDITTSLKVRRDLAELTLKTNVFARYVLVEIDGITAPLTDNYFDIEGGKSYGIAFQVPDSMDAEAVERGMQIRSFIDVQVKGNVFQDKLLRLAMRFHKQNFLTWLMFKFI